MSEFTQAEKILKEYNIHPPFIHKGFHAKFYPIDLVELIWNRWGDYSGFYYKLHISTLHDEYWDLYYLPEDFTRLRNHYFNLLSQNKKYILKHYSDWKKSCNKLNKKIQTLEKNFVSKKFSILLKQYQDFIDEYLFEYALAAPVQEACGFQPEQWINPEIENYCKKCNLDYQQTSALLVAPIVHSFITEEQIDLIKIALINKEKLLTAHQKKWFWIQNNYAEMNALPIEFFKKKLEELKKTPVEELKQKLKQLEQAPKSAKEQKKALFKRCPASKQLKTFIQITELFAEMQDVRKSFVLRANYYHKLFLERASTEFKQSIDSLWYYSYHELLKSINAKKFLSNDEIIKRKKIMAEVASKKEQVILSGDEAQYFFDQLQEKSEDVTTFKGTIAQRGKITGKVRIVMKSDDISKVSQGDILVASMTRPEMTPAMHKAAGFITDEGGITSHAAIVAREMKKPCIIGTKIATKVLKDGDIVEVDAEKGIVKKLK